MPRAPHPVRAVAANYSLTRIWLTLVVIVSIIVGGILAIQTGTNATTHGMQGNVTGPPAVLVLAQSNDG